MRKLICKFFVDKYSSDVKKAEHGIKSSFDELYPDTMKFPEFNASSIPLGMDGEVIYRIEGNTHLFKILP